MACESVAGTWACVAESSSLELRRGSSAIDRGVGSTGSTPGPRGFRDPRPGCGTEVPVVTAIIRRARRVPAILSASPRAFLMRASPARTAVARSRARSGPRDHQPRRSAVSEEDHPIPGPSERADRTAVSALLPARPSRSPPGVSSASPRRWSHAEPEMAPDQPALTPATRVPPLRADRSAAGQVRTPLAEAALLPVALDDAGEGRRTFRIALRSPSPPCGRPLGAARLLTSSR